MTNTLQDFWASRSERERRVYFWGGIAILAAIILLYVLLPLHTQRKQLRASLPQLRADAVALEHAAEEAVQLKSAVVTRTPGDRNSFADAAGMAGLAPASYEIVSASNERTSVRVTQAPFDQVLAWIDLLQRQHRMRVDNARLQAQPAPNSVSGEIEFVAGSATE